MKWLLVASAVLLANATPAAAQYYYGYPPPPPRHYQPQPYWGPPGGYYQPRPRPRRAFGNLCVTSRGNCQVQFQPANAPCRCFIPGFGAKRGAVAATHRGW